MAFFTTVTATTRARHKRPVPAHSRPADLFGRPAKRRRQVYVEREVGQPHAFSHVRAAHEERDVYILFVGSVFTVDQGVLAVAIAVVGGEDEERVIQLTLLFDLVH